MSSGQRILIVEDDRDTRAGLTQFLTDQGYSVVTADNGQQALDLLDRGIRPHLIVIDLMLPRVTGFDLITYLHSDHELRLIPTIVITALARDQIKVIADVVIHKPLELKSLLSAVKKLLPAH